jgi:hypothetical protein
MSRSGVEENVSSRELPKGPTGQIVKREIVLPDDLSL